MHPSPGSNSTPEKQRKAAPGHPGRRFAAATVLPPLPAEQREYKPIAPGERITVHKGNGTSVVIFAFSNYEGTKNYNTTDNYFEFTVCDSRGRGRTAVLSTNRDEWFK